MPMGVAQRNRDEVQIAVADPGLGDLRLGEGLNPIRRPVQQHRFDALIVIEVGVHCGYGHFVMRVLRIGQAHCQLAMVVIVKIAQYGNTRASRLFDAP